VNKETNNSKDRNDMRKPGGRRNHYIGRNMTKWNKRTRSIKRTEKGRWIIMGGKWNHLYRWKNLCAK